MTYQGDYIECDVCKEREYLHEHPEEGTDPAITAQNLYLIVQFNARHSSCRPPDDTPNQQQWGEQYGDDTLFRSH